MIEKDMKKIRKNLQQSNHDMRFQRGVSKEQIRDFERQSNIVFPDKFKEWLKLSDGGDLYLPGGFQIYGIAHKPIIDINSEDVPKGYIMIGALCNGEPIMYQNGSQKIFIYDHETGIIHDNEIFDDFYDFLNKSEDFLGIKEE